MPWRPGQSGNPSGRPASDPGWIEFRALARDHSARALGRLAESIESPDEFAAIKAAAIILERAWGRPATAATPDEAPLNDAEGDEDLTLTLARDPDARRLLDGLAAAAQRVARDASRVR